MNNQSKRKKQTYATHSITSYFVKKNRLCKHNSSIRDLYDIIDFNQTSSYHANFNTSIIFDNHNEVKSLYTIVIAKAVVAAKYV